MNNDHKSEESSGISASSGESESLLKNVQSTSEGFHRSMSSHLLDDKTGCRSFDCFKYIFVTGQSGGFFAKGIVLMSLGLALPTLSENLRLNLSGTSSVLSSRGAGFFIGSLSCGLLEGYISGSVLYIAFIMLTAVGVLFTPLINVIALNAFVCLSTIGMGGSETIGNVLTLEMWGSKAEPVIQFLHFWFCVGSAVSPFLFEPFINEAVRRNITFLHNETINGTMFRDPVLIEGTTLPLVSVPYIIIFGLLLIFMPCSFVKQPLLERQSKSYSEELKFRIGMLVLLCLFYFIYVGGQVAFLTYLYSFGLSDVPGMGLDKTTSAHLNSVFLFAIIFGQLCAIFMSRRFSPAVIISVNLFGMAAASITMLFIPYYGNTAPYIFWIAVGLFGFSVTSIYGTTFLWADYYITVNARAASVFVIGCSAGEMVYPIPVALYIDSFPMYFLYYNAVYVAVLIIFFVVMHKTASLKGHRKRKE